MKLIERVLIYGVLFFLIGSDIAQSQLPKTGLYFYSHTTNIDQRTSLALNDEKPYQLRSQDIFSVEFKVFMRDENIKFGYFFRIISNKHENFDLIINNLQEKFLIIHNRDYPLKNDTIVGKWVNAKITFDKKHNEIRLIFNHDTLSCSHDLSETNSLSVYFGACDYKGYAINDVSPIIIKDVIVSNNERKIHHWTLGKHAMNSVYDDITKTKAIVHNPYWLMDNGIHWSKEADFEIPVFAQVTFDSINNDIILLTEKNCIFYSLVTHTVRSVPIEGKIPLSKHNNQLIYNPVTKQLLTYNFDLGEVYFFDPVPGIWNDYKEATEEPSHAHHNRYISPLDSMMYLFGGYGFYQYKSDLFRINLQTKEWTKNDLSHTITPRYLAAMGGNTRGDKVYILGGRGSEIGRQELSPKNFFDLYEFNLSTQKIKHLYDFPEETFDNDYVFSNSLVVDDENDCCYALAYPNNKYASYILLKKINLLKPQAETLGDTIDFYFQDITSYCDLYYSPSLSKLIAVTAFSANSTSATVNIYSLNYPPLKKEDVLQADIPSSVPWRFIIVGIILVVILIIASQLIKRYGKNKLLQKVESADSDTTESENAEPAKAFYQHRIYSGSILFLGGFQVFDKNGKNITGEFTPTLKFLLVIIVLYTLRRKKGISSGKLQELLWFDKAEEAARNNRNVNLRKLRVLLDEVGNIDISNADGYWMISIGENVFLDYQEILSLIEKVQSAEEDPNSISRLLELLSHGALLPNIQFEWIDSFKNDFSDSVIDTLFQFLKDNQNTQSANPSLRLKTADVLLAFDSINEEAISVKCNALYKLGKKGLAKIAFDNFEKEYKSLLGENYPGTLKTILQKE